MSKRYYLAPVVGAGTLADPYRARVADLGGGAAVLPSAPDGRPRHTWALCLVAAPSHTALLADAALDPFPAATNLDAAWTSFGKQARDRLLARLSALGVNAAGIGAGSTFRDVLRLVGRHLDPAFDERTFDVAE